MEGNIRFGIIEFSALDADAIEDKSKATWFNKAIATLRITWFLAQLIGRAVSRLPITPLELSTLGHVIRALAMYYFWLYKPFDF